MKPGAREMKSEGVLRGIESSSGGRRPAVFAELETLPI